MSLKDKIKRFSIIGGSIVISLFLIYLALNSLKVAENVNKYLPTESILKNQVRNEIKEDIDKALINIMDRSDFELAVHVNLNQDEITEELIKYEPKEVSTSQLTENLTPIPKVNTLPGLIDNPFHNESLPGFPSYFDQFDIEKDDFVTRGLFAKILSVAYQLPKETAIIDESIDIVDNSETEFSDEVTTIVNENILKLYQTGEFRPNEFLTNASLITALVRINYPTSNYYSEDVISDLPFKDITRDHWAYNYIKVALENKLIEEDILFNPNRKVSVEQTLNLIEKTPLRSDIFNYYQFPKKKNNQQFRTDNKKEITESNIYYNQETTFYKSPSTKINNISIRLLINEVILDEDLSLEEIEEIVRNVVEINEQRNDSLVIKSYAFTNLPIFTKIYKWKHWQKIYFLIILFMLGYAIGKVYLYYKKMKLNQQKIEENLKRKKEKLEKIHEEEEEKAYKSIKKEIFDEAYKDTDVFTFKLEKWLELIKSNPQFEDKDPNEIFEKLAVVILFVDYEKPGLSSKIIKKLNSEHVKEILDSIESIDKISVEKTKSNLIEFHENFMSAEKVYGGQTTSNHIIEKTFSEREKRQIFNIDQEEPFTFLNHADVNKVKEFIVNENNKIAAYLLNKCTQEKLLEITELLPGDKLKEIAKDLINVKNNPCELMDMYEDSIKDKLFIGEKSADSINKLQLQKASSVFETLPKDVRASIFSDLERNQPQTLEEIKAQMFMFDDIILLPDVDTQTLVFEVRDMTLLATALKNSPSELAGKFQANFSERFQIQYNNAQEDVAELTDEDVDKAQYSIVRALRRLEKEKRISNLQELKRSEE